MRDALSGVVAEMDHELQAWLVDWPTAVRSWRGQLSALLERADQNDAITLVDRLEREARLWHPSPLTDLLREAVVALQDPGQ